MTRAIRAFVAICIAAVLAQTATAQTATAQPRFPDKPVRVVVPFAAGGSFDMIARELAVKLQAAWKVPVVIENRAGAGGNIGAQFVAAAPADGYTLLFWGDGVLTNPLLYAKPPFDALRDFAGVAWVATTPQVLVSNPDKGPNSMADVVAATRPLNYGTAGNGTPGHLAAELMKRDGAKQLSHVPYKGGNQALTDLLGGQIDLVSTGLPACIAFIESGRIKAIAVTSKTRIRRLPNVPTVGETLPGYEMDTWFGVMAPKATPLDVRQRIAADLKIVLADAALQKRLADAGFVPAFGGPAQLDAKMSTDLAFWRVQVAKSGATAQ